MKYETKMLIEKGFYVAIGTVGLVTVTQCDIHRDNSVSSSPWCYENINKLAEAAVIRSGLHKEMVKVLADKKVTNGECRDTMTFVDALAAQDASAETFKQTAAARKKLGMK